MVANKALQTTSASARRLSLALAKKNNYEHNEHFRNHEYGRARANNRNVSVDTNSGNDIPLLLGIDSLLKKSKNWRIQKIDMDNYYPFYPTNRKSDLPNQRKEKSYRKLLTSRYNSGKRSPKSQHPRHTQPQPNVRALAWARVSPRR